ncbi:MAG: 3-hydroxyacyl-CoA dehydrogenase NAD-binding domain-containing protein, partial [Methanobacteriota archaeon]
MTIKKVCVVGAGTMGSGIAQACAQAGVEVHLNDTKRELLEKGLAKIRDPLMKRVSQGKTTKEAVDALLSRIHLRVDIAEAV